MSYFTERNHLEIKSRGNFSQHMEIHGFHSLKHNSFEVHTVNTKTQSRVISHQHSFQSKNEQIILRNNEPSGESM